MPGFTCTIECEGEEIVRARNEQSIRLWLFKINLWISIHIAKRLLLRDVIAVMMLTGLRGINSSSVLVFTPQHRRRHRHRGGQNTHGILVLSSYLSSSSITHSSF